MKKRTCVACSSKESVKIETSNSNMFRAICEKCGVLTHWNAYPNIAQIELAEIADSRKELLRLYEIEDSFDEMTESRDSLRAVNAELQRLLDDERLKSLVLEMENERLRSARVVLDDALRLLSDKMTQCEKMKGALAGIAWRITPDLIDRVNEGMTTEADAKTLREIVEELKR